MLKHFQFAVLLATLEIVFVNGGYLDELRNRDSNNYSTYTSSKPRSSMQFRPTVTRTQYSISNNGLPNYQKRTTTTTTTFDDISNLDDTILSMVKALQNQLGAQSTNSGGNQLNAVYLCCDDDLGTFNCETWDDKKPCPRKLSTRNTYDNSPFGESPKYSYVETKPDSTDVLSSFDSFYPRRADNDPSRKTSGNFESFGFGTPNDNSQSWTTQYQPTKISRTPQPKYNMFGKFGNINLASLFPSRSSPTSGYNDKRTAADPNENFLESSSPRTSRHNDYSSRNEPVNASGFRFIPPRPPSEVTYDRNGRQWRYKKQGPYKALDRAEFHRDMLDRHNYYRRKHRINLFDHDSKLDESAQSYANKLAASRTFQHSGLRGIGENIYYSTGRVNRMGQVAADNWWSELRFCTTNETASSLYRKINQQNSIGHLTQMLWIGSTRVGFGVAKGRYSDYYVVAHYSPQGNVAMPSFETGMLELMANMLPLPFQQKHIAEATKLALSHSKTVEGGIVYSGGYDLTSEEKAQDFETINT